MLEKLLAEIRSGGTFEVNTLASRLQTTPVLVKAMLNHLQTLGYIQAYQTCGEACGGCYLRNDCRPSQLNHPSHTASSLFFLVEAASGLGH